MDLSLGEETYSVDIVEVGTLTTRAIPGIDFLMNYNGIVDVGKVQLILGKEAPLELHRVRDRCKNQLVCILRKALGYSLFRNRRSNCSRIRTGRAILVRM